MMGDEVAFLSFLFLSFLPIRGFLLFARKLY